MTRKVFWEEKAFTKKLNVDHTYVLLINHLSVKQKTTSPYLLCSHYMKVFTNFTPSSSSSFSNILLLRGNDPFTNNNNIYGGGKMMKIFKCCGK